MDEVLYLKIDFILLHLIFMFEYKEFLLTLQRILVSKARLACPTCHSGRETGPTKDLKQNPIQSSSNLVQETMKWARFRQSGLKVRM